MSTFKKSERMNGQQNSCVFTPIRVTKTAEHVRAILNQTNSNITFLEKPVRIPNNLMLVKFPVFCCIS